MHRRLALFIAAVAAVAISACADPTGPRPKQGSDCTGTHGSGWCPPPADRTP